MNAFQRSAPGSSAGGDHRLHEVPLFAGLPPELLEPLARASRLRRYPAGQVLWTEGDPGDALLVLEAGRLRVSRYTASGSEIVLAVVEAPAALGELALLDGQPRDATVTAQGAIAVRLVPRQALLDLLERQPEVVRGLLATLAGWVRHANQRHADQLGLDVPGRLAKWLLRRAGDESGVDVPAGSVVKLDRTQGDLAAELGTTRESLNRALRVFADLELVAVDGEQMTLLDPESLAMYAD